MVQMDEPEADSYDSFVTQNAANIRVEYYYRPPSVAQISSESSPASIASHTHENSDDDSESQSSEERASNNASPISSQVAEAVLEASRTFKTFEELKKYAETEFKCKLSNNKRTSKIAPKWIKMENPDAEIHWFNGTLYCMQPLRADHSQLVPWAKTSCTCYARYSKDSKTRMWRLQNHSAIHNHELDADHHESASGMVHINDATLLGEDQVRTICCWLDAMQSTKQIRFHFRKKYPNTDVKRRVIRSLRNRHKKIMGDGMDLLIEKLNSWDQAGGVGKLQFANMEVAGIQVQHPLIRAIAKMFGVVTTIDGTHNTTKHEKSTLICATGLDSFGHLFHSGLAFSATENVESMHRLIELLGLDVETLISDASKASLALVQVLKCAHILCSYHYRKLFSQSMDNMSADRRKLIWESVMKALRWNGYKYDDDLMQVSQFYQSGIPDFMFTGIPESTEFFSCILFIGIPEST